MTRFRFDGTDETDTLQAWIDSLQPGDVATLPPRKAIVYSRPLRWWGKGENAFLGGSPLWHAVGRRRDDARRRCARREFVTAPATPFGLDATGNSAVPKGVEIATLVLMQPTAAKEDGRTCRKCGEWKPRRLFYRDRRAADGMQTRCRACISEIAKARYWKDVDASRAKTRQQTRRWYRENKESVRRVVFKHEYGITLEQYDAMLREQNNVCAICEEPCKTKRRLSVDHDHSSRVVRGLLCHRCNSGIGQFGDDPARLERAIQYLRRARLVKSA